MPLPATDMGMSNGAVEPPPAEAEATPASLAGTKSKGRGLRRWRRIAREHLKDDYANATAAFSASCGAAEEDSAQLHKRRLPLAAGAGAPKGKAHGMAVEEEASSSASVESRFVPLAPATAKLDPNLGALIASSGFSVGAGGADSDNSEDRSSSRSSTAASAPRHSFLQPSTRERADRDRAARSRTPGGAASLHGKNPRAARARADKAARAHAVFAPAEAENSRSSVESNVQSSNAMNSRRSGVSIAANGNHKVLADDCDHSDEGQPSEEARSTAGGYYKENGSASRRLVRGSGDDSDADVEDTLDERSVGNGENGLGMHPGADPYAGSIFLLQRTQQALENEIQKFEVIGKESNSYFDVHDDDWSESIHSDEPLEEASEKMKDLESRLEEACALIKEKDSRIVELEALNSAWSGGTAIENATLTMLQSDLDQLLQEKMEAETQCIILIRASQNWAPLADDQTTLYKAQKTLSGHYKQLECKLRHTENRAVMLAEMAEKLEAQCKELSGSSEVLRLQSRASTVSIFCFIQFILLFIALGIFLVRLLPISTEVVPT